MIKTFTRDELIRYIYGESTKQETEEIVSTVLCDNEANSEFDELTDLKQQLDSIKEEPSRRSINNILNYSRRFEMPQFTD